MKEQNMTTSPKIADDEKFIRNVESMIEPSDVSDLICISSLKKLLPSSLFKKVLFKTSKKFPQIGFVIEPYCLFLFFKISDTAKAQAMLPDRYKLMKARIFSDEEPDYYFGMGIFNTKASTFWGSRLEVYLIAKDSKTNITSWIFLDILSNTIIAHPAKGITDPNTSKALYTTNSKGEIFLDFLKQNTDIGLNLKGKITGGKMRPLEQDLWIMGNASVAFSKNYVRNSEDPFAVIFDPAEVKQALDIPVKDISILSNTLVPDWADTTLVKAVCFPYTQHYIADSPGLRTFVENPEDMIVKYNALAEKTNMKTFSAKSVKIQLFLGIILSGAANIILLMLLLSR